MFCAGPPVIEPFSFPKTLQEGGRAQVTCSVSSGDMPVYFSWRKDGYPIPINLQVINSICNHLFSSLANSKNVYLEIPKGDGKKRRILHAASVQGYFGSSQWSLHVFGNQFGSAGEFHQRNVGKSSATLESRTERHSVDVGQCDGDQLRG